MTVNFLNPFKSYYAPECRNCKQRNCKNCPIPISKKTTLRAFLEDMVHKTKFNDNARLFINQAHLTDTDTDDEEDKVGGYHQPSSGSWTNFQGGGINNSDDEDMDKK
jgi:hypothetical protein